MNNNDPITALMLLSSHCAYCPSVLDALSQLIKQGKLGKLEVINLEINPNAMQTYQVRSVPWVRIGKYELTGAQTIEAIQQRIDWAIKDQNKSQNWVADFDFLLSDGQVDKVINEINKNNDSFKAIMSLLGDEGTVLSTRIGIGVVFEEFAGQPLLKDVIPQLGQLSTHQDVRIRADSLHYLGFTNDDSALAFLNTALQDSNPEIKEIASDSLDTLHESIFEND